MTTAAGSADAEALGVSPARMGACSGWAEPGARRGRACAERKPGLYLTIVNASGSRPSAGPPRSTRPRERVGAERKPARARDAPLEGHRVRPCVRRGS